MYADRWRPDGPAPTAHVLRLQPAQQGHWTYRLFVEKRDPENEAPLQRPADYDYFQINPVDNGRTSRPGISTLCAAYRRDCKSVSCAANSLMRRRTRCLRTDYRQVGASSTARFPTSCAWSWRSIRQDLAMRTTRTMTLSGSWSLRSGRMAMRTCSKIARFKAGPETWGKGRDIGIRTARRGCDCGRSQLRRRHGSDGRYMLLRPRTPFKKVTASRGKGCSRRGRFPHYTSRQRSGTSGSLPKRGRTVGVLDRGISGRPLSEPCGRGNLGIVGIVSGRHQRR